MNSQDNDDMLRQMRTLYIRIDDGTNYYALFITVLLTLN